MRFGKSLPSPRTGNSFSTQRTSAARYSGSHCCANLQLLRKWSKITFSVRRVIFSFGKAMFPVRTSDNSLTIGADFTGSTGCGDGEEL